jgi:hypothetical protein
MTQPCQWLLSVVESPPLQVPLPLQHVLQVQELPPLSCHVPEEFQDPEPLLQPLLPQLDP